jgi:hypothetical protein
LIEIAPERIEPFVPERLVPGKPVSRFAHRGRSERAGDDPAGLPSGEEARVLQRSQVLHEARQRHLRSRGELGHATASRLQCEEHSTPRRIGKRREREVEWVAAILNHMV